MDLTRSIAVSVAPDRRGNPTCYPWPDSNRPSAQVSNCATREGSIAHALFEPERLQPNVCDVHLLKMHTVCIADPHRRTLLLLSALHVTGFVLELSAA